MAAMLFLISPAVTIGVADFDGGSATQLGRSFLVPCLIFAVPAVFFYRHIKLYFYLLIPLVIATPFFIFSTLFFDLRPGFEMVAFVMQTNPREITEAAGPFMPYFIPFEIVFIGSYLVAVHKIPIVKMPFRHMGMVSAASLFVLVVITVNVNDLFGKRMADIKKYDLVLRYDFPVTLVSGVYDAGVFLTKNTIASADSFVFNARKKASIPGRELYVLIIGESSRYDHWQINGYPRQTSPRLRRRNDLIIYDDAVAGAHYTWMSVPMIITRADPESYDLQYREKRDVSLFSPTYSPNMEFEDVYDGRLLHEFDSLLRADTRSLFVILHTMGNHWEYTRRYPREFDTFKPSGYTQAINPPVDANRQAIINSYDNSILYADFFIDSVIGMTDSIDVVSSVVFISDHGEDLFDLDPHRLDFHFRPSVATLKVPLFVWTSDEYDHFYSNKRSSLEANAEKKIGSGNIFHTVLDIADIRFDKFDSTRSFAGSYFVERPQKYYNDDKHAAAFAGVVNAEKQN